MYKSHSLQVMDRFEALGPFPMGETVDLEYFSILCLECEINSMEVGNFVAIPSGSWLLEFEVDAVFMITDLQSNGALLDRVWRSSAVEKEELSKAKEEAEKKAVEAGTVDENGVPIVSASIVAGDLFIPRKIFLNLTWNGRAMKVLGLNRAGVEYIREGGIGPGYSNPVASVNPMPVIAKMHSAKFLNVPSVAAASGNINLVMPSNIYPPVSYKVTQSILGLQCFKILIGRDMELHDYVMNGLTTIDNNCAFRLSHHPMVTDNMRKKSYISNPKLLIALMSANFSIARDPVFAHISLVDFADEGRVWTDTGALWQDLISAAWILDTLFRPNSPKPFFADLFGLANIELTAVTIDMLEQSKFEFVKDQICSLWQRLGLFVKNGKHLLEELHLFDERCYAMFKFEGIDLKGILQSSRNLGMDRVISDYAKNGSKRDRGDGSPNKKPFKKQNLGQNKEKGKPGIIPKGFCMNYYAHLAKCKDYGGVTYTNCANRPIKGCDRFNHIPVTAQNKDEIFEAVKGHCPNNRVREEVKRYLASF